ncbi:MAG TPA: alpha/beta hydrolase [Steroidobacteraceae bacterium]|nr:alpha/beta hydrolase [Gammaproteobacteria bacterium]HEV2285539.1 alpha/beta hydrolase [Steroidobacteraceae bacterium]
MPPCEYWFESHDGLRLFGRVYPGPTPAAPVVLCLHGLMRNSRDFEDLAPHLSSRYRVIVPDVRGRGFSARDPKPENYQVPVYIKDLEPLFNGLGVERAAIVGTSMGGLIAMVLAALQPARVARIVLNDVGPEIDPVGLERIRGYAGKGPAVQTWAGAVAQMQSMFASAWPGIDPGRWEALARRSYRASTAGVVEADADPRIGDVIRSAPPTATDLWPLWRSLAKVPVLALRGALSDVLSVTTLERMQREKPDLQAVTIPGRGHAPLLDEAESLAAIDAFLAAGGPTAAP